MTRFEQRIRASLDSEVAQIPVILGLCGSGRTTILRQVQREIGQQACQYVNVERTATTPERFLSALVAGSPFRETPATGRRTSPRQAFDDVLAFLSEARCADGAPATFLLDGVMELRTFESFPGLRRALPEALAALAASPNRFALASRYIARAERALEGAPPQFRVAHVQGVGPDDIGRMIPTAESASRDGGGQGAPAPGDPHAAWMLAVQRLADGRAAYARAIVDSLPNRDDPTEADPLTALARSLEAGGPLFVVCSRCYELRLHRARGYGALKAILEILAEHEPLTLTEVSQRLGRTPGSTKDYLSWLEDVDLVAVQQKRYRFRDALLRVFVRLHCLSEAPTADEVAREVQAYGARCLGGMDPAR